METLSTSRRTFLRATAGAAVGAGALAPRVAAQETAGDTEVDLAAWFSNTDNVSGTVDKRGQAEITVNVGAEGNGGSFGFSPAAVRIDPGTTVTWEWTGGGGSHNVVAESGAFESEYHDDAGATYAYTPNESGIVRYACAPHKAMGMKGALLVGDVTASLETEEETETRGRTFDGWLDRTDNYTDVVDERGKSEVVVDVGVDGNGGAFGFGPAAIRVDPGTTVVWRWKGTGGAHNVAALDGSFRSDLTSEQGAEFARTFEGEGVVKYGCEAHAALGMRGVVVVDDGEPNGLLSGTDVGVLAGTASGLLLLLSPLGIPVVMHLTGSGRPTPPDHGRDDRPLPDRTG